VLGIVLLPPLSAALLDLLRKPDEVLLRQHLAAVTRSLSRHAKQVAFELACLPYEAFFSLDAIVRTVWRMLVSRRRLLEWNPSSEVDRELSRRDRSTLGAAFRTMWLGPLIAFVAAIYLTGFAPESLLVAAPVLLLWLSAPGIAWWISRPLFRRQASLSIEQRLFLRAVSRRTWAFFDNFVGPDDNWLPPDNFPGIPGRLNGPSHLADQHRSGAAGQFLPPTILAIFRPEFWLTAPRIRWRPWRALSSHNGPLLQLVRHANPGTPAAPIHFDGGQRQSRPATS
jgi:hypothetical protein